MDGDFLLAAVRRRRLTRARYAEITERLAERFRGYGIVFHHLYVSHETVDAGKLAAEARALGHKSVIGPRKGMDTRLSTDAVLLLKDIDSLVLVSSDADFVPVLEQARKRGLSTTVGCRAMLELAVDVALITSEPTLATRMWAFEESAKLKSCNRYRAFAIRTSMTNPNATKMTFGSRNEAAAKALRRQHWGTENHPQTWFGKPFEQMAAEADRRVGSDYEAVYTSRYDELCWGTHGSTLALIRPEGLPSDVIPAIACAAVGEASRLALELTERAASFLGLDGEAICNELFAKMQAARERHRVGQP